MVKKATNSALELTDGERDIVFAIRRIPGSEANRLRAVHSIIEFVSAFAEGVSAALAR